MMNIESKKQQLQKIVDEVNSSLHSKKIKLCQQEVSKKHIDIADINENGRLNGRLNTHPTSKGYDIGLQGESLARNMFEFMRKLTNKNPDKYGYPSEKKSPKWEVDDINKVKEAVLQYAKTVK